MNFKIKYKFFTIVILGILASFFSLWNINDSKEYIVMTYWMGDSDSILYIEDVKKFNSLWKFEDGKNEGLLCGYTYALYAIDSASKGNMIGLANKDCSTIVVGTQTFYNKINEIKALEKLAKVGTRKRDTVKYPIGLNAKISSLKKMSDYLGYSQENDTRIYSVKTKCNPGEIDSIIQIINTKSSKIDANKFSLKKCSDNQLCGIIDENDAETLGQLGIKLESKNTGYIFDTYWK